MPQQGLEVGLVYIDLPRRFARANLEPLLYALGQIVDFAQLRRADVAAQPLAVAANLRRSVTPYAGYALKERRVGGVEGQHRKFAEFFRIDAPQAIAPARLFR